MMKYAKLTMIATAWALASPVMAQNVQDPNANLYNLIDLSDGYFSIRENVVMIEGESEIKACHFGLTPAFFAAYGAGDAVGVEAMQPDVICVSISDFNVIETASDISDSQTLYDYIDNSESYVQIAQNIVMIEGEESIEFCHFDLSDNYFAAVGAKDEAGMADFQPSVTCAPFGDVSK